MIRIIVPCFFVLFFAGCDGQSSRDDSAGQAGRSGVMTDPIRFGGGQEANIPTTDFTAGQPADVLNDLSAGRVSDTTTTSQSDGDNDQETDSVCQTGIRCVDERTREVCDAEGRRTETACGPNEICVFATGMCAPKVCEPASRRCLDDQSTETCSDAGDRWVQQTCSADRKCNDGLCIRAGCLPQVLFALDGSSSMISEWDNVRASVNAVVSNNPQVAFGLLSFPVSIGCSTERGWPHVGIQPNASPAIEQWFMDNGAAGGATPLIRTMEWIADNVTTLYPSPNSRSLIIMTEGLDRCTCREDDDDFRNNRYETCLRNELADATNRLVAEGVDVYVIGYKFVESSEILNVIASNGNTDFSEFIFAGSEETLTNAFDSIIFDVKRCL